MNVQSRYLGNQSGVPRFRFPSRSECRIFGLPVVDRLGTGEGFWLSEGVTDCLALLSSGRKAIAQGYKLAFPANSEKLDKWLLDEDEYRYW